MRLFILILSFTTVFLGCSNDDSAAIEVAIDPKCLQDIVNSILAEDVSNPKRSISSYTYNEQIVYVITPSSFVTESATNVVDINCTTLCLIGGIDGDANDCDNFENVEFLETIWTDPR